MGGQLEVWGASVMFTGRAPFIYITVIVIEFEKAVCMPCLSNA